MKNDEMKNLLNSLINQFLKKSQKLLSAIDIKDSQGQKNFISMGNLIFSLLEKKMPVKGEMNQNEVSEFFSGDSSVEFDFRSVLTEMLQQFDKLSTLEKAAGNPQDSE